MKDIGGSEWDSDEVWVCAIEVGDQLEQDIKNEEKSWRAQR